jgi:leucyl-tRNA synthetase
LRAYLMFMGPFSQGGDFRDTGIEGMHRFLRRVWALLGKYQKSKIKYQVSNDRLQIMHKTIKRVTEDIESLSYNTAIAAMMEWYNFLSQKSILRQAQDKSQNLSKEEVETFLKLLAPFAPHLSEELYQVLSNNKEFSSIHLSSWPECDPKYLVKREIIIVIQINGKLRGNIIVDADAVEDKAKIEGLARKDSNVAKHLDGKQIRKIIYVEGKVLNFVVG